MKRLALSRFPLVVLGIALAVGFLLSYDFTTILFLPTPSCVESPLTTENLKEAAQQAIEHVLERKVAYEASEKLFSKRGLGYMHDVHGLALSATVQPAHRGRNTVQVRNVLNSTTACDRWAIWVRVNGPEIFAGSAAAVDDGDSSCHWEFAYDLQVPGDYQVDVKVISYNGQAEVDQDHCQFRTGGDIPTQQYPYSEVLVAFKMWSPNLGCCEICARTNGCRYWTSPPISSPLEPKTRGCELFFDETPQSHTHEPPPTANFTVNLAKVMHGPTHSDATAYFVGCGWSFWLTREFSCLDPSVDDAIPVYPSPHLRLEGAASRHEEQRLPVCQIDRHERFRDLDEPVTGRWVREPWPDVEACPEPMRNDTNYSDMFEITEFDPERPHCWHRDDLSIVGLKCAEFCAQESHKPWISSLHEEKQWFGEWRNYDCAYRELTNGELQQCVDRRQITGIRTQGRSIAKFLNQYLKQRLQGIILTNATEASPGLNITLSTFSFPHILWRESNSKWQELVDQYKPINATTEEYYGLTGFYYSSEREPFVHIDRSRQLSRVLFDGLSAKGYRMIEAFDLTAAFTYDTATQMDGLHIIGPPAKMIITKLFHYVCKDVL